MSDEREEAKEWKDQVATYARRLTEVIAERDELLQTNAELTKRADDICNERDAAREALKPFTQNVGAVSLGKALGHITREDLHRARAAYEKGGKL